MPRPSRLTLTGAGLYGAALILVGLWPNHIDEDINVIGWAPVQWMIRHFDLTPAEAYNGVEFGANVVLFVPLGLLAMVWSRTSRASTEIVSRVNASTEKKAAVSVGQGHPEGSEELRKWLSGLKPVTGADTMLRFTKTPEGSIDLTHAHPSGLAQLMAGRRTRLSTLIRDHQQYVVAARASRNLRSKIL